jgi:hypothetical protein
MNRAGTLVTVPRLAATPQQPVSGNALELTYPDGQQVILEEWAFLYWYKYDLASSGSLRTFRVAQKRMRDLAIVVEGKDVRYSAPQLRRIDFVDTTRKTGHGFSYVKSVVVLTLADGTTITLPEGIIPSLVAERDGVPAAETDELYLVGRRRGPSAQAGKEFKQQLDSRLSRSPIGTILFSPRP